MPRTSMACGLVLAWLLLGAGTAAGEAAPPRGAAVRDVTARVLDSSSGEPLPDAVIVSGRSSVTTDGSGRFTIPIAGDSALVTVQRIGYRPLSFRAAGVPPEIRLPLAPVLLNSLRVTASAAPSPRLGDLSQLSLVTTPRAALAERAAPTTAEALAATEGIATSRPGSWGSKAFLRGLGGERVVVLLDGNRINRACNMGMDAGLATVNPDNVERVEVLSGPGSTLYGSGNLGGVVNVVTRGPRLDAPLQGEIRMAASSAVPGGRFGGTLWGRRGRFALTASADGASYGDERTPRGVVPVSSFRDATFDLAGSYRPAPAHRLEARVQRYAGRDIGYPGSAGARVPEEDRWLASLDWGAQLSRGVLDGVNAKAYLQSVDHHMTMSMTMPAAMGTDPMRTDTDARSDTRTWGGRAQARLRPAARIDLDAGFEATQWNAEGTRWVDRTAMGETVRTEYRSWPGVRLLDAGSFTQGLVRIAPWLEGSAGARLDWSRRRAEGFDATTEWIPSGNAGLRLLGGRGLYARAGLGFGYRIPDPTELFGLLLRPDGYVYSGNPDLRTEKSRSVEAGAGWTGSSARASVTFYRNRITDYIATVVTGDSISGAPVRAYRNVASARIDGVSAAASVDARRWLSFRSSAGVAVGKNLATGAPLPMVPPFEGTAAIRFSPARGPWIEPELEWALRQTRVAAGETRTPGFAVVNVRAGHAFGPAALIAGVENALDQPYRQHLDPVRVLRPGRNVFLKVTRAM
ncbi:MAG: TonB-dependent receptor domain-containing protein [Bacteroidota bacterium]